MSGLLANMYLNYNDKWFISNNSEDKMIRYVDDIMIFTNKSYTNNVNNYTEFLTNELGLMLNTSKTENGEVSKLEFYNLNDDFDDISKLCNKMYNSLYNLPSDIYKLYLNDNKKIINILYDLYNSIGINIAKSWLPNKLRKRKEYSLGLKINYGKMFEKKKIDTKYLSEFKNKNSIFMNDLYKLKELLGIEFKQVYEQIKQGNNSTVNIRKFKYLFNKLGIFTNSDVINKEVFNYITDNAWLVDLRKFKGYPELRKSVSSKINDKPDYIYIRNMLMLLNVVDYEWLQEQNCDKKFELELAEVWK